MHQYLSSRFGLASNGLRILLVASSVCGDVPTSRAVSSVRGKINLVKRKIESTRIIRGRPTARDVSGWENASPDERFAAVWELSRLVMEWSGHGEPRLQRSVCRVQRSQR